MTDMTWLQQAEKRRHFTAYPLAARNVSNAAQALKGIEENTDDPAERAACMEVYQLLVHVNRRIFAIETEARLQEELNKPPKHDITPEDIINREDHND